MSQSVRLGYAVGSGDPVDLPLHHLVVTGQTQMAGKTTTLEALIARSGLQAVAFVTKRGEGSFADARTIRPYFREQADWQFVASILEASRGEKLKFERAWIIRASRGARSLADVQRNVRKAMDDPKTRGMSADVYLTLDAYLEAVVPQIARVEWATSVMLGAGLNVMDLTALNVEMQHLVIRSTIDWVLQHASDTVVVVPEAWKFIPQGRGTPVKLAAESYIRQSAGLRNYLWLDSQDIAGVEKLILKSVPVWVLGVQREANEIKRTLAQIPAGIKKPKPEAIATLGLGEFFACYGTHTTKVYVQPAWMSDDDARAHARGEIVAARRRRAAPTIREDTVNEIEAEQLRNENADLRRKLDDLRARLEQAESSNARVPESAPASGHRDRGDAGSTPVSATDTDALYQDFKRRLLAEPAVARVLMTKKEISVEAKREIVTLDGTSWLGRVAALIAEGFFDTPQKSSVVFREASRRGATGVAPRADEACKKLLGMGFLTREEDGFKAVEGMKVNIVER